MSPAALSVVPEVPQARADVAWHAPTAATSVSGERVFRGERQLRKVAARQVALDDDVAPWAETTSTTDATAPVISTRHVSDALLDLLNPMQRQRRSLSTSCLLTRPEHSETKAKTKTRECETETETKKLLWDRNQKLRDRDREQKLLWYRDQKLRDRDRDRDRDQKAVMRPKPKTTRSRPRPRPKAVMIPRPKTTRPRPRPRPKSCYETEAKNYQTETETSMVDSIARESKINRYALL